MQASTSVRSPSTRSIGRIASIVVALASSTSGCDSDSSPSPPDAEGDLSFRAPPPPTSYQTIAELPELVEAIDAATLGAADLPRAEACKEAVKYGAIIGAYLAEAYVGDVDEAHAIAIELHERLRCVSAREFATFQHALFRWALASADLYEGSALTEVEELLVPVVIAMDDLGGSAVSPMLRAWLREHAAKIRAATQDTKSLLSDVKVTMVVGPHLAEVPETAVADAIDLIEDGRTPGCGISEMLHYTDPGCPRDCTEDPDEDKLVFEAWTDTCDDMRDVRSVVQSASLDDKVTSCLFTYTQEAKQGDASVCLRTAFAEPADYASLLDLETRLEPIVVDDCALQEGGVGDCVNPVDDDEPDWLGYANCLEKLRQQPATGQPFEPELEAAIADAWRNYQDYPPSFWTKDEQNGNPGTGEQGNNPGNGGDCASDVEACPSECGIESYQLQKTEECFTATNPEFPVGDPEPIDPIDPEVDPDSPLGHLLTCLEEAVADTAGGGDGTSCEEAVRCLDGTVPKEVDGVCVCRRETMGQTSIATCEQLVDCTQDSPCECEGEPIEGPVTVDDPLGPRPVPTAAFQLTLR